MFEFMKGKVQIDILRTSYKPGEKIQGTVRMNLDKPIKARGVVVGLKATRVEGSGKHQRTVTLYEFEKPLDMEREYRPQPYEYKFELDVPDLKLKVPNFTGFFGGILNALVRSNPVRWSLFAKLDIPMGIDISKTVRIDVESQVSEQKVDIQASALENR
jgi:hypothetical protein